MINGCEKGKAGEREWRDELRKLGCENARRGRQFSGSPDSPDVVNGIPGTHVEVKREERLNVYDAIDQAVRDSGARVPYVAHRRNRRPWLITIRAQDLVRLAQCVAAISGTPVYPASQKDAA